MTTARPQATRLATKLRSFLPGRNYLLALTLATASPAQAAILRPFTQITGGTVRLADLFDNLGSTPDRILGAAPAPGARITVASPQLAAIARDFNVDWRPQTGGERAIVERRADAMPQSRITEALRQALAANGAPDIFDIASPDIQPVLLPAGAIADPAVSQLSYDPQTARFTALVAIAVPDSESVQIRVSGQVIPMAITAVAATRLSPGHLVTASDMRPGRVRAALLRGASSIRPQDALGMAVRHDVTPGQILTLADLTHPALVQRGALVRMLLDSDGLSLSAQGIAAEAGARGERIHVENPLSHRVVMAEVMGPDTVRVAPNAAAVTLVSAP